MTHPNDLDSLKFRDAVEADVEAIVALVESAYRGDASRAGWTTEADMLDGQRIDASGVLEVIARPDSRILLLETNGALLACCHIEKQAEACYFGMFSVQPEQQGSGVGKRMMRESERVAREEFGCTQMQMTVITLRGELIAWYARRGYAQSGIYRPFPYGDARFGIPKRDDLKFELLTKSL